MASAIEQAMIGIESRLDNSVPGLRTTDYSPGQINPPQAIVTVPPIEDYNQAYGRGKYQLQVTIIVLTSASLDRPGQMQLAEYSSLGGAKSIPAAINADNTLGGAVEHIQVVSFRSLGMQEVGVIGYFGGEFTCRVLIQEITT